MTFPVQSFARSLARTLGLILLTATPLSAQSQDDLLHGALLPGWQAADGSRMAALHLQLAPDWKTYWRAPGEAGIPPVFDWSGSTNLASVHPLWPSPEVIQLNGMQAIGYHDELVLPLQLVPLDPTQPIGLRLRADLGICKDICMPASLSLKAVLSGAGNPDGRIDAALAAVPISGKAAGLRKLRCDTQAIEDGLRLKAHVTLPRQGSPETLVFEVDDPAVWVAQAQSSRSGSVLTGATDLVSESATPFLLDRSRVTITVIGQGHSVEIRGCPAP